MYQSCTSEIDIKSSSFMAFDFEQNRKETSKIKDFHI
jgi:hypothetical protein